MTIIQPLTINLEHTKLVIRNDRIIQINSTDRTYDVEDIYVILKAVDELTDNQKVLLLFIASDYTLINNDAIKFLSTPEAGLNSIAKAFVIKSLSQRLLLNFLIKVNGTPVPVNFFNEINLAVTWLAGFKNENVRSQ